jgi:hypothetical protein
VVLGINLASLVVVGDFNVVRMLIAPCEADPILIVDSDAVLPITVALQRFEPIPWQNPEVLK